jgi:dipicolinate synthase subunit A
MKIAVIGGDRRMSTVARLFCEAGFDCKTAAVGNENTDVFEAVWDSAVTVLPLPYQKGGKLNAPTSNEEIYVEDIFAAGSKKTLFIGGMMPPNLPQSADYSMREDFLLKNAVLTAEGAIEVALRETDFSLFGSNAAVFGYGRIGARLASLLAAFGARVTVVARRSESRSLAEIANHHAVGFDQSKDVLANSDIVFNTVPSQIFGKAELAELRKDSLFIDLASAPYGLREEDKCRCAARIITASGLPGKTAFESAGKIIFETVVTIMRERGIAV